MEKLFALAFLWAFGFIKSKAYSLCLDEMFLNTRDNELLIQLEECSDNYKDTFAQLNRFFKYEADNFDADLFGSILFQGLEKYYYTKTFDIAEYGKRCYKMWLLFPDNISTDEPFFTLNYADDCLSYGDEKQCRQLYENAFNYYKQS